MITKLTPVANVIKLFTPVSFDFTQKARVFVPLKPFQFSKAFVGKARAHPVANVINFLRP
jgi:hypothetical protein